MIQLVFFLEERSAGELLDGLLPRLMPQEYDIQPKYVFFAGKQDLDKRLVMRMRAWKHPNAIFVVLRDQDRGDCSAIKSSLTEKCLKANKPHTLVRIACRELESWYLGDLSAVETAIGPRGLGKKRLQSRYREPDSIEAPSQELKRIAPTYQKIRGSRRLGLLLATEGNRSASYNQFIQGLKKLVENVVNNC